MKTYQDLGTHLLVDGTTIPKVAENRDYQIALDEIARGVAEVVDPPPASLSVPQIVSRFQARAALLAGGLLDDATAAVEATGDAFTKLAWAEAAEWRRDSALVVSMATAIGLTSGQVDDLFRAAAKITA